MAIDAAARPNLFTRTRDYYTDTRAELARVTWPDWPQVRQLSIGVVILALVIGAVIALMDLVLQQVLVRWIPAMFGGR